MAKPAVAESRVALVDNVPEVALVRLPKGKRRRTCVEQGSETKASEVKVVEVEVVEGMEEVGIIVATTILRKLRGMVVVAGAPVGLRRVNVGRGVVNPNFPMFFNQTRRFAGDREKWPAGRGGGYR